MIRVSDLIDLPISTLMEESCGGYSVKSLLLDGIENKISAIVCKEGTLKKSYLIIPYHKIISIDMNGITIADANCIKKLSSKEIGNYLSLDSIMHKLVKNRNGELRGIVTDIYINPLNGQLNGFELSEGYIDDIVNGRRIINITEALNTTLLNKEIILYERRN